MSYSEAWQRARQKRAERRASDPVVQDRKRQHEARQGREGGRVHVTTLAQAAAERGAA